MSEDGLIRAESTEVETSLSELSGFAIEILLDESEDVEIFSELLETNLGNPDVLKILREHPRRRASEQLTLPALNETQVRDIQKFHEQKKAAESPEARVENMTMKLRKLTVGEKIKVSSRGNKEVRGILIRDTNKLVVLGVINNPKITDSEIEMAAKSRNIMEEALRAISKRREWMKNYNILHSLISNPKTPTGISVHYVDFLKIKDLVLLEKNKNIPEALKAGVRKVIAARKEKK
jgi:hypothetical protein